MKLSQCKTNILICLPRYRPKNESFPVDQNETKDLRSLNFHIKTTIPPRKQISLSSINTLTQLIVGSRILQILNYDYISHFTSKRFAFLHLESYNVTELYPSTKDRKIELFVGQLLTRKSRALRLLANVPALVLKRK